MVKPAEKLKREIEDMMKRQHMCDEFWNGRRKQMGQKCYLKKIKAEK